MIDLIELEKRIKKNEIGNCYVFCGYDEKLIKENIKIILDKILIDKNFYDLNFNQFDGAVIQGEEIINACETLPLMSDKRAVLIYRADFLGNIEDRNKKKLFEIIFNYVKQMPQHSVLIMYYVFESKREKPSSAITKLDKKVCVIKADKLKGDKLAVRVKDILQEKGIDIGKLEFKLLCNNVSSDLGVLESEIDKLYWYTYGRDIKKEDILLLFSQKSDDDIFDLVDFLAQRRGDKAIEILNELIFKGEKIPSILYMVERQFKLLLLIKLGIEKGKDKHTLASQLKLNPYICEKMIVQSRKFTVSQLQTAVELCIEAEKRMKSSSADGKTEMELLILGTITAS